MSGGLSAHLLVPNGKTAEMNGASSADQVLLSGVSLLHSLIIVGSCLLMTQSSSTENHYPGCVMEIVNVLYKGGPCKTLSEHRFVPGYEKKERTTAISTPKHKYNRYPHRITC